MVGPLDLDRMTGNKANAARDLRKIYDSIKEVLLVIKPRLDDLNPSFRPSLTQDLHKLASLAEAFTEQRSRSGKSWMEFADSLDQEGVHLWNISGLVRKTSEDDGRPLVAGLRLSAFRLVEAGLEAKPGIEGLLHVLQLASKTGANLSEIGSHDVAARVLTSGAKFEEVLRHTEDPDGANRHGIACGTIAYFSSRMEAAWKEKNYTVAAYMSHKITDDEQRLSILQPHLRQLLASKFYRIGKSVLQDRDNANSADAVTWLQKAFFLVDHLDDNAAAGVAELKISILQALARAYFVTGSYDRAEATLEELIPSIDAATNHASTEYRELRWLRLATLKRRKAGDVALLDAFKSLINHMDFSEGNITDVLQDLRTLSHQHTLVAAVHQYYLQHALSSPRATQDSIARLLLSLIFHCTKDENHARALEIIESTFTSFCQAEAELESTPAMACLTLLWQRGDRHYQAKKWSEAADWFMAGTHKLFRTNTPTTNSKCFRKAALCYIEQREFARASTVIRRCPMNEAKTHYVIFLLAVHQGLEDEAIDAVQEMQKAFDFDRNMLLLATNLSHQAEMRSVLMPVLEALLKTLKFDSSSDTAVEAMTLIRCIIRLAMGLLADPAANRARLIDTLANHFQTARTLTEAAVQNKALTVINKDVSWLWRTAYNCAVQGCSEWEGCTLRIADLFDVAKDLLEALCQASPLDTDPELYLHIANAAFAAVSGHVFALRESMSVEGKNDPTQVSPVIGKVQVYKARIVELLVQGRITSEDNILRIQYCIQTLHIFHAELLADLKEWDKLSLMIEEVVNSGPLALGTYEAVADILWKDKDCPMNVLYGCLEALLRSSLDHSQLSVEKFSRWLRAICTIVLARNTPVDRIKAIGYVEQALTVIEGSLASDEPYPMDERQWLLATSYNTGAECLHASMLDEAKRWFEASTVICRFVPGGKERAEKISETYLHLLSRYETE